MLKDSKNLIKTMDRFVILEVKNNNAEGLKIKINNLKLIQKLISKHKDIHANYVWDVLTCSLLHLLIYS